MRQSAVERAMNMLTEQLSTYPHHNLPPLRELAAQFRVSVSTAAKAARELEAQGRVVMGRGRRIEIVSQPHALRPMATSAETLHLSLHRRILNGIIKVGEALPKVAYVAAESHVSVHTVLKAYRMLVDKNLAFKRGRTWIAGPKPDRFSDLATQSPPVVLLLQNSESSWRSLCYAERTSSFCRTFVSEAEERGVRLLPVFPVSHSSPGGIHAGGVHEVIQLAIRLGTRYLGALIAASTNELPELALWVKVLTQLGKPVVWFDRYDQPFDEDVDRSLFTRCHFSEDRAVSEAVEFLYESGHRTIAYANLQMDSWRERRLEMLKVAAMRYGPEMTFTESKTYGTWPRSDQEITDRIIQRLTTSPLEPIRRIIAYFRNRYIESNPGSDSESFELYLLRKTIQSLKRDSTEISEYYQYARTVLYAPVLADLLSTPDITAVVVPHDWDARHFYYTLESAGLSVPHTLSLLSFDNYNLVHPLPISTIDFGFGYLGYCAFHLLLGDIHIDRDAKGNVPAHPRIVNRGSVGAPRRGPLDL